MPKIKRITDTIVTIEGARKYKLWEPFLLAKDTYGTVMMATEKEAKLLVFGDAANVKVGKTVKPFKENLDIKVYNDYFGKIITPFGSILHPVLQDKPKGKALGSSKRINKGPSIMERVKLNEPLETGILAIDTMIPIGKGQRELIIGDRSTGKSSIALNTIINQKDKKTKVIYVAIGQKRNSVISFYNTLKDHGALDNTIVLFANPDSSPQQFYAPTVGMAMAEALAYKGEDVLIIFDDLTKHANVYREISLSIGRNPGREAYPTDIFYQHSSLLERAGKFGKNFGNGSITALPIVETVQEDIASLIPSNIISITDGQIFTNAEMFNKGLFPAIDVQLSVSRTGSSVQSPDMKELSAGLKQEHAMLSEIKKFADMSIDISQSLMKKVERWHGLNNLLIQFGYEGYTPEMMQVLTYMYKVGALGKIEDPRNFSNSFRKFVAKDPAAKQILQSLKDKTFASEELLEQQIAVVFAPLAKAASNVFGDLISAKEYKKMKGAK